MGDEAVSAIGARVRAARQLRGVSVRGLARDIGVSGSLISQIETGKSLPSVSTLYAITTALDVPVESLFGGNVSEAGSVAAGFADAVGIPTPDRAAGVGPHLCHADREVLKLDTGVTWERLGQLPGKHVDFLLINYRPGSTSATAGDLMRHAGTEYGYLTEGELILTLGFDEYRMKVGDSVCFDSTTPHGYRNESDVPAIGVWFVLEDS